jgi:hypothetical protein
VKLFDSQFGPQCDLPLKKGNVWNGWKEAKKIIW